MTSVGPMGRYAKALARFGVPAAARRFYEVHVTADEVHQHVALDDMVAGLVEQEPDSRRCALSARERLPRSKAGSLPTCSIAGT